MDEYKEKIKSLYNEGKSCAEIGRLLGKSGKTISYHVKNLGLTIRTNKKIDDIKFKELWDLEWTDQEIADYFKSSIHTVTGYRNNPENKGKYSRKDSFSESDIKFSEIQEQMVLGSLLGDLSIRIPTNCENGNARLSLVQSEKQEELFMEKVKILGEFMASYKLVTPKEDDRTGKIYKSWRGSSRAHKLFTKIYNELYINDVKTITSSFLAKIHHPIALAYWFMDDGTERGTLATHCFSSEEVTLLINWMLNTFEIECTRQKNSTHETMYIKSTSRERFERLILPYIIPSMRYKLIYFKA